MRYLRGMALSRLSVDGSRTRWSNEDAPQPWHPGQPPALRDWLWRAAGMTDVVLLPDGAWPWSDLDGLRRDAEGTVLRARLGELERVHLVARADGWQESLPADRGRYRRLPIELLALPWSTLERAEWSQMSALAAAAAITEVVQHTSTYEAVRLPPPDPGPAGELARFLFASDPARRCGHCQHFSTAAAALLRRAGHPVRLVVGYASDEQDPEGVTFRARDAHAWIEIPDAQGRWTRFDPTPAVARAELLARTPVPVEGAPLPVLVTPVPVAATTAVSAATPSEDVGQSWWWSGLALPMLAVALWWRGRRPQRSAQRRSEQAGEDLIAFARSIGIGVAPGATLPQVAAAVERRTAVPLARVVSAQQAARFGRGPAPPAWPWAELRAGARRPPTGTEVGSIAVALHADSPKANRS